jgi:enoyl-CoA hydratase / 3-hydroxyacyl-CoA dehydrogenase
MSFSHRGRSLSKIAVIGSGQIGPDIALFFTKVFSPFGVKIVVVDVADAALAKGEAKLAKKIAKGVESGAFSAAQQASMLEHVEFTNDYDAVRGAEFVVEAATEDKGLKSRIFGQVEGLVADDAILASNSSHLEPEVIFADAKRKDRALVIHYFFPAERNLMVEIVPGADTDQEIVDWLMSMYEWMGKVPIEVKSRYGYAVDPVFEGLFLASALIAESGVATTKQIDTVARKALGLGIGSFTAMNLTGGNPITNVGLDNYTSKINSWYRSPQSLKDRVANGTSWETPERGEKVEVSDDVRQQITDDLRGAFFGICGEIVDAGLATVADMDMGVELALVMKGPFSFMNELGAGEALRLVRAYAAKHEGFPVPRCIEAHGAEDRPFEVASVIRRDDGNVAVLTIRRPKVLNALNEAVFDEIQRRVEQADADRAIEAVVLTGFGKKAFVSGADVNFLAKIENEAQGEATSAGSQAALNAVEDANKPIVCAMNGLAFGGGNELAMACTMRIARKGQKVFAGQPEPNIGIIPGAGGTQRLPRLVGFEAAANMLRTGRPVSSEKALAMGLISEEVDGDLVSRAIDLARQLAHGTIDRPAIPREPMTDVPDALPDVDLGHLSTRVDAILCKAILEGARMTLRDGIAFEAKCFGEVSGTEDMRIGVANFLKNGPRAKAEFVHA